MNESTIQTIIPPCKFLISTSQLGMAMVWLRWVGSYKNRLSRMKWFALSSFVWGINNMVAMTWFAIPASRILVVITNIVAAICSPFFFCKLYSILKKIPDWEKIEKNELERNLADDYLKTFEGMRVLIVNHDGNVIGLNRNFSQVAECNLYEIEGMLWTDFILDKNRPQIISQWIDFARGKVQSLHFVCLWKIPTGDKLLRFDGHINGKTDSRLIAIQDVSALRL